MNNAASESHGCGLGSIISAELTHDIHDMPFDGAFGNSQRVGNALIALAIDDQLQYFQLPGGEFRLRNTLGKTFATGGGTKRPPA